MERNEHYSYTNGCLENKFGVYGYPIDYRIARTIYRYFYILYAKMYIIIANTARGITLQQAAKYSYSLALYALKRVAEYDIVHKETTQPPQHN